MQLTIRQENESDWRETEDVVREAFWNVYMPGASEHFLVHRMRHCPALVPELNLVAVADGRIVGHVMNLKACIEGDDGLSHEVLSLGPIAVLPQYQGRGIGARLIAEVKAIAKNLGYRAILLCGNPAYYLKLGFEPAEKYGIRNAENMWMTALHVCSLDDGALASIAGRYFEDPVYQVNEKDVEAFDRQFPVKELKTGTPSQRLFLEIASQCRPYAEK